MDATITENATKELIMRVSNPLSELNIKVKYE
jgi:hypothetical protein